MCTLTSRQEQTGHSPSHPREPCGNPVNQHMHERTTDIRQERYARECCRYGKDNRGDVALPCMKYTRERARVLGEK